MSEQSSAENDARTTGHAWAGGGCANCAAMSPRPWAESCYPANGTPTGLDLIRAERERQIDTEGWTPGHDAAHGSSLLLRAAEAYEAGDPSSWPWDWEWWKPKDALRNLIRAGALYQAADDVSPGFDGAARSGVMRCSEKIDAALDAARDILTRSIPPASTEVSR